MQFDTTLEEAGFVTRVRGVLTDDGVRDLSNRMPSNSVFDNAQYLIVDLSEVTSHAFGKEALEYANAAKDRYKDRASKLRIAIVVTDIQLAKTLLPQISNATNPFSDVTMIVTSMEEARAWVAPTQ